MTEYSEDLKDNTVYKPSSMKEEEDTENHSFETNLDSNLESKEKSILNIYRDPNLNKKRDEKNTELSFINDDEKNIIIKRNESNLKNLINRINNLDLLNEYSIDSAEERHPVNSAENKELSKNEYSNESVEERYPVSLLNNLDLCDDESNEEANNYNQEENSFKSSRKRNLSIVRNNKSIKRDEKKDSEMDIKHLQSKIMKSA